jgi:thiol-disulfide isomerase/thioredoxin
MIITMKKLIIASVFCFLVLSGRTQTANRLELADIEVRDSSGTVYPTEIVRKLIATGKYGIRLGADRKTGLLYARSEADIARMEANAAKPPESRFFKTGEKLSSFSERDMNGTKFNLKEMEGKVVVLNFWFINCPPCRAEIPQLNEMVEKYRDNKDVVFIAVALDEKWELKDFLKKMPFNYNIIDNGRYLASKWGISSYPTHVVLSKQSKVLFHTSGLGMTTLPWIKKSIEAALNDTEPK